MRKQILPVAETFYSIQGEGQTMGVPAVFLRLGGCNLLCEGAGWRCDTIEVWQKSKAKKFEEVLDLDLTERVLQGAHLIITGGEPLLHQHAIVEYLTWFQQKYQQVPNALEIETNGTIIPSDDMFEHVTHWNVSPKLSTTGEPAEKRINREALVAINWKSRHDGAVFKFVISCDDDVDEAFRDYSFLPSNKFVFMPAGSSQQQLEKTRQLTAHAAMENMVRYCDRLHIGIWNQKTGV